MMSNIEKYMKLALKEAKKAEIIEEVPIGAVIVLDGEIIAKAHNLKLKNKNSIDHAEILAIKKASKKIGDWRLEDAEMYVTLEPCPMCAGAIMQARIKKVYFGAYDPKGGSVVSLLKMYEVKGYNHYPEYEGGILEEECSQILKTFFKKMRQSRNK